MYPNYSASPQDEEKAGRADAIHNAAQEMIEQKRRKEAVAPFHEAVVLYRELAAIHPTRFQPILVEVLAHFADCLRELNSTKNALTAAREGLGICRTLTEEQLEEMPVQLASLFETAAYCLFDQKHREESESLAQIAVERYRALAQINPARFRPKLASALKTLSNCAGFRSEWDFAIATMREALEIYGELAQQDDEFIPDLAAGVHSLSAWLRGVGKPDIALSMSSKAVRIYRGLVQEQPYQFMPYLGAALESFASCMAEAGQKEEALEPRREAIALYRKLEERYPGVFRRFVVIGLAALSVRLKEIGREAEARMVAQEAEQLRGP